MSSCITKDLKDEMNLTQEDKIKSIKNGIEFSLFESLGRIFDLTQQELAHIINISQRTLHRRKNDRYFNQAESDRIIRIVEILNSALNTFEDEDYTIQWLKTNNIALNNNSPLNYSDTEIGAREVITLLVRLDKGIYL